MNVLVDTSAFVGLAHPSDPWNSLARAFVRSPGLRMETNAVVIGETYTFLQSRFGYALARQAIRGFVSSSVVSVTQWSEELDARTFAIIDEFSGVPLSYADASLVAMARESGLTDVFSFDDDLRLAGLTLRPG